jgi:hypothetical protein
MKPDLQSVGGSNFKLIEAHPSIATTRHVTTKRRGPDLPSGGL